MADWEQAPLANQPTAAPAVKAAWEQAPVVGGPPTPHAEQPPGESLSGLVGKYMKKFERGITDDAAILDLGLSLPAAGLALANEMGRRAQGIVTGEKRATTEAEAKKVREKTMEQFGSPVAKLMALAGYGSSYGENDVDKVMKLMAGPISKGGKWIEEKTNGLLTATDVDALVNEVMVTAPLHGAGKAMAGVAERIAKPKPAADIPQVRLEGTQDAPPKPTAKSTPAQLAKQHIEQSTGIADVAKRDAAKAKQRADARAAFAEDPGYADYLRNYADEEVRQRQVAAEKAAAMEKGIAVDTLLHKTKPPEVTWNQALTVLKKPGFRRTPEDMVKLRAFEKQGGKASPDMLIRLAAVGITGTALYNIDPEHPLVDAALAFGAGMAAGAPKATVKGISEMFKPDPRLRVNDLINDWETKTGRAARTVWQNASAIAGLAPDIERRNALTHWMQGDKSIPITQKEQVAAGKARDFFDNVGQEAMQAGVLHNMIPDYVTNLWDLTGKNKPAWNKLTASMSPKSRFDMERKITSIAEGKKLGLVPVTEDLAHIMTIYGNSMYRTMANKQLLDSLENKLISPTSVQTMVMAAKDAPDNYVKLDHPQLMGKAVHPEIANSLAFVFHSSHPLAITKALEGVNTAIKRSGVGLSLFHANSLIMAGIGAGVNPLKVVGMVKGTDFYLQQLRRGGVGDIVDRGIRGGLRFTYDKGPLAVEDVGQAFYDGMDQLAQWADKIVPYGGSPIRGLEAINKGIDHIMWSRLHTGLKLNVFAKEVEKLTQDNTRAHMNDPRIRLKTPEEIDQIAASYTNDVFGGLNWRRVAEEAKTAWGRDFKLAAMGPQGRRVMQIAMFAPDWTISVTRSFLKQFTTQGTGVRGLLKPQDLADLHRRYYIRNALFYATAGDALNYFFSGHHIWENGQYHKKGGPDWTSIDLGDGRYIPWNKHSMEPMHWMMNPLQQAANKLGYLPSEGIEQLTGKQYINVQGKAPPMDTSVLGRTEHALKHALPFSLQQAELSQESLEASGAGMLGFPIRGKTEEQRRQDAIKRKLQRASHGKGKKKKED